MKDLLRGAVINLNLIKSVKTKSYLVKNRLERSSDLQLIVPHCYTKDRENEFYLHHKKYALNHPIEDVWKAYQTIPPNKAWSGRRIQFSFSYDYDLDKISYEEDEYDGLKEGQLIFLEIKVGYGILKLAVTHQVNKINEESKTMKFCYVEGGKASGSQLIKLVETGPHTTEVIHDTYYKSDSKFRDEKLYPIVHERIINEFHKNVKNFLEIS